MMKSSEYWQKRFELLEQAAHQQGVQCYADIEKQYRQAQKQLEGQIAAWYQRFASNNGIIPYQEIIGNYSCQGWYGILESLSIPQNKKIPLLRII